MGLEGIVSKQTDAPYRSGRSRTWLKSKNPASAAVRREREEEWRKAPGHHACVFTKRKAVSEYSHAENDRGDPGNLDEGSPS
jgi:hypothetical protein